MSTHHSSIRATAFAGTADVQWERVIKNASRRIQRYQSTNTMWAILGVLTLFLAVTLGASINEFGLLGDSAQAAAPLTRAERVELTAAAKRIVEPIVADEQWKRFGIIEDAPSVLGKLQVPGFKFQNQNLPVVRVDGETLKGKMPPVIWLKLEQPGNTIMLVDTEHGVFVRFMEEMSPGFISRCKITPYNFGTLDGSAAEIDVTKVKIKNLWIIQDADATSIKSPGWVAVSEPTAAPEPVQIALK
jgi:hypothetical protein